MQTASSPNPALPAADLPRLASLMLNVAHAFDHMFLLIFATAVVSIASEFGFAQWEDLMPYGVGAFIMFGAGSLPSGRLGDLWGRRRMMVVFFFGMGAASLLTAATQNAWQLAATLSLIGLFASIYHPVGIPMLVQRSANPGAVIGINGLAGNMGVAGAALLTGFLVKEVGWRAAFIVPGLLSMACGLFFLATCPPEAHAPARRKSTSASVELPPATLARVLTVMTAAGVTGSLLFNFLTNGNSQLLSERFRGLIEDPASLGLLLAIVYAVASLTQIGVGRLIDRMPLKPLYLWITAFQIPMLALAAYAQGWWLFAALLGAMMGIFGAVPFTDAVIVRYVDDRMRSRVSGVRLTISLGVSSLAVWLLGPLVKGMGFSTLLLALAVIAAATSAIVLLLPPERRRPA
ncbi:MAG: MFS transporter [Burkholderiaceae bacterium]|uniref:MFS transporter n=1 Tax=Hydrogenophaga sp. TaxID=1904254 RepID=UPI002724ABE9|nr:MFS transporter [Hydrogenophaga sp.]MDO8276491.1 MFS transporter [Burkholderiaceae bacterium]MDO9030941.1 MFS transporter [Hydrogenophaga sp.]MDP1969285.1 MFS transporter [Burkholderiaceae bacterium]